MLAGSLLDDWTLSLQRMDVFAAMHNGTAFAMSEVGARAARRGKQVGGGGGGHCACEVCHEECSGGGTTFRDFLKLSGHTRLNPWPEVQAAMAERPLDRQAWRDALRILAPLESVRP
eukprot:355760-Chlamydomonas_euryale.AAC.4